MHQFLAVTLVGSSFAFGGGSILVDGHLDLSFNYQPSLDRWVSEIVYGDFDTPDGRASFDEVALPLRDLASGDGGERFTIPGQEAFGFLGASPGEPIWILTQSNSGFTWPGFRNDQPDDSLASYTADDPRVSDQGSRPWIKIGLEGFTYVGIGSNPQVSIWQNTIGDPLVWVTTADGIDSSDAYYQLVNGHSHVNWGFTEKGLFRLSMRASAYRDPGMTNPTQSEVGGVIFAVGSFAVWKAAFYSGADLFDDAVTGLRSDSDADGVPLILEYAFNLSPVLPDARPLGRNSDSSGLPAMRRDDEGRLQIEFVRRRGVSVPEIEYEVQFASDLEFQNRQAPASEVVTPIDEQWENVVATDHRLAGGARFGRIVVNPKP